MNMRIRNRPTRALPGSRRIVIFFISCCVLAALVASSGPAGAQRSGNQSLDIAKRVAVNGSFVYTMRWVTTNSATTMKTQIVESPVIVVGQAVTHRSRLTADRRGIAMDHEIFVLDVLKGDISKGSTLRVVVPGGRVEFNDGAFAQWNLAGMAWPEPQKRYVWFLERAPRYYLTDDGKEELYAPASGPLGIWELEGRSGRVRPIGDLRSPLWLEIRSQRLMANGFIKMIRDLAPTLPTLTDVTAGQGGHRAALTARHMSATRALRGLWTGTRVTKPLTLLEDPRDVVWKFVAGVHAPRDPPESMEDQVRRGVCQTDAVVIGTLTASAAFLTDDAMGVLTEYKLHVTDSLAGSVEPGSRVSYVRPGGAVNIRGRIIRVASGKFPELDLGVPYILSLRQVPGDADSFAVTTGARARWVVDAIELGDLAVGRSPWSLRELEEGVEITRVLNAIDAGACQ